MISDETIKYVAALAKLELSEEEQTQAKKDLSEIINYVNTMETLDTDDIPPMTHIFSYNNVFREDEVTNGDKSGEILQNAPAQKDCGFKVPKTVE